MKERLGFLSIFAFAAFLLLLYLWGVKPAERCAREFYYQYVVRNLVDDKTDLLKGDHFMLGMYRPELPYQFGRLYEVQERMKMRFSLVSYYQAWGDGEEYDFRKEVNCNLTSGGFTPLITWEPWVSAFRVYDKKEPDSSLLIIASGDLDPYIRRWARAAVKFGKPFFLRPGHEMSNDWYGWSRGHGNSPEIYKAFWRKVYDVFQQEGARNVAFVWNPYQPGDTIFYPGNAYVDWIGLDIFNFGALSRDGFWMDFYTVSKLLYDAVKQYDKPVLIAETGCASSGGNKPYWFRDMFHVLATGNFPLVRGLVIFDTPHGVTTTGIRADLGFSDDTSVYSVIGSKEFAEKLRVSAYLKGE